MKERKGWITRICKAKCPYCGKYNVSFYKGLCPQCPPGASLKGGARE